MFLSNGFCIHALSYPPDSSPFASLAFVSSPKRSTEPIAQSRVSSTSTMASVFNDPPTPPGDFKEQTVQVHALQAGHLTLPERFFVNPASETARKTVPSLSFLIQHHSAESNHTTRILLDLGIRRSVQRYPEPIQKHIATRQPLTTDPDVTKSLAAGGLKPDDIDYVIYTHVSRSHSSSPTNWSNTCHRCTGTTSANPETSHEASS